MLPGWYGFGSGGQGLARRAAATTAWRLLQAMYRDWPFFRTAAVEHGHGAGQERHRHRLALRRAGRRRRAARARSSRRLRAEWQASIDALLAITRQQSAAGEQPAAGALDPQPLSLPRSAQPPADRAAASATAPATPTTSVVHGHPPDASTASPPACATAGRRRGRFGDGPANAAVTPANPCRRSRSSASRATLSRLPDHPREVLARGPVRLDHMSA